MIHKLSTKELLAESLKELSRIKAVDKITIKELTRNCGMTSPTFMPSGRIPSATPQMITRLICLRNG